jgi:hypothetical protein
MLQLAEVKDTSIAFKPFKDDLGDEWPLGTIKVQLLSGGLNERARFEYAIPATFCKRMPVIGEHVILVKAASYFALGAGSNITRFYYLLVFFYLEEMHTFQLKQHQLLYI